MLSSGPPEYYREMRPTRPTVVPPAEFMQLDVRDEPSTSQQAQSSQETPLECNRPPPHFMLSPGSRDLTSPSRPSTSRQRPEKKDTEGPYYRASKPWHRQEWQDELDTPLSRYINNLLVEKVVEHSARNTCSVWSPLWTQARLCKWWICVECEEIPRQPVTTTCGHTLCRVCAERNGMCQCSAPLELPLVTNVIIMTLVNALAPEDENLRRQLGYTDLQELGEQLAPPSRAPAESPPQVPSGPGEPHPSTSSGLTEGTAQRLQGSPRPYCPSPPHDTDSQTSSSSGGYYSNQPSGVTPANFSMALPATWCTDVVIDPMDFQARPNSSESVRFRMARDLVASGSDEKAVPYLSGVATFGTDPLATFARDLILVVIKKRRASMLVRNLRGIILRRDARRLIAAGELDCILCAQVFRRPVTTPCGHTYCRACIERSIDYTNACPLCSGELIGFNVDDIRDTVFLARLIQAADLRTEEPEPEVDERIPIFVCTVAYPMVPCPLFVFEPRYRLMIRRCLRDGSRRFGIVGSHSAHGFVEYGTILEVRDSIRLADGRHIISTIGLSRFRILERGVRDGYDVARVEPLQDTPPNRLSTRFGHLRQNMQIRQKAEAWLHSLDREARAEVETTFGAMPPHDASAWTPDGPAWLWWVLALLPLDNNLKVMILSNLDVRKRMAVVERTLQIIQLFSAPSPNNRQPAPAPAAQPALRPASHIDARLQRAA